MGVSAQKPAFSDAEQSCIRKTRKPLCVAQNKVRPAAPERLISFGKSASCVVQACLGYCQPCGGSKDSAFGSLVLASLGVDGWYLSTVGGRWPLLG